MTKNLTAPASKIGLPSHVLRRANVTFKAASAPEQGNAAEQYAMRALAKRRQSDRTATAVSLSRMAGTYNGAELQPYQGRPGSLDFLALPSLMGKRRVYRADQNRQAVQR